MWQVENRSPFPHHAGFLRDHQGRTLWSLHLKASFRLRPGLAPLFVSPQPPLLPAPLYDGPRLIAEAETGLARPLADLILSGAARPPALARPDSGWQIEARCGTWRKAVQVLPARRWREGRAELAPQPLAPVPLDWRRTFGGPEFAANPLGLGDAPAEGADLPRLAPEGTDPRQTRFAPTAFAPIPRDWPQRVALGGTYDAAWLRRRAPLLPEDLDPRFWQAAPADQWLDPDSLAGARLELAGFGQTPQTVVLPDCRFEIATRFKGRWAQQTARLQSVCVDLDAELLALLWQADLPIGASQNDVSVERSFIALRSGAGFAVAAEDAPAFGTPAEVG
jgi:hypothetical protein